ncbi:MAG: hypothetical protein H0U72_02930 [Nitrosospira sp.]|nr:hypothetical protein [Nitrosospira sp.]
MTELGANHGFRFPVAHASETVVCPQFCRKLLLANQPLLHQDIPTTKKHRIFEWPEETMALTPEEHILVENFRHMAAEQKAALKRLGMLLLNRKRIS